MTEQKHLRQIARAIRGAVADALFAVSGWFAGMAHAIQPVRYITADEALAAMGRFGPARLKEQGAPLDADT